MWKLEVHPHTTFLGQAGPCQSGLCAYLLTGAHGQPGGPWDAAQLRPWDSIPVGCNKPSPHPKEAGLTETTSAIQRLRLPLSSLMVMGLSSLTLSMASGQSSCGEQMRVLGLAEWQAPYRLWPLPRGNPHLSPTAPFLWCVGSGSLTRNLRQNSSMELISEP